MKLVLKLGGELSTDHSEPVVQKTKLSDSRTQQTNPTPEMVIEESKGAIRSNGYPDYREARG